MRQVKKALEQMESLSNTANKSTIMKKKLGSRISTLNESIEKLIIPRIILGEDLHRVQSLLKGMVKFFGGQWESLGTDHLDEINKNLQDFGPPSGEVESYWSKLEKLKRSKLLVFGFSLLVGFTITIIVLAVTCSLLSINFMDWLKVNLGAFFIGGATLSALLGGLLLRE